MLGRQLCMGVRHGDGEKNEMRVLQRAESTTMGVMCGVQFKYGESLAVDVGLE